MTDKHSTLRVLIFQTHLATERHVAASTQNQVERLKGNLENFSVEEEKSPERLVLGRSGDVLFSCEVRQKGADVAPVQYMAGN